MKPIVITTTSDNQEELASISRKLIDNKLAGCCQIVGPIESIYRWQDQVESAKEWMCLIKSFEDKYAEIESMILETHHYDEPEIIMTEISGGSVGYLDWLSSCTK